MDQIDEDERKWNMNIDTWNVQGRNAKIYEVMDQLKKYNIQIAALTEMKMKGKVNNELDNYILFYSGVEKHIRAKAGVGIAVHKKLKKHKEL